MYGAYQLRKTYNETLVKALSICFALGLIFLMGLSIISDADKKQLNTKVFDNEFSKVPAEQPVEKKKIDTKPLVNKKQFTRIVISKDSSKTDSLHNLKDNDHISNITVFAPDTLHKVQTDITTNRSFIKLGKDSQSMNRGVDIEAEFPGGIIAWRRFLEKHIDPQAGEADGAPAGTYTVKVHFAVSIDGTISDVKAETNNGYGLENEAVKIIRTGPKWIPAKQNGNPVNAYRIQPVVFVISEN